MKRITYKDIMQKLDVSASTAQRYLTELRKHYNLGKKPATKKHLKDFFG